MSNIGNIEDSLLEGDNNSDLSFVPNQFIHEYFFDNYNYGGNYVFSNLTYSSSNGGSITIDDFETGAFSYTGFDHLGEGDEAIIEFSAITVITLDDAIDGQSYDVNNWDSFISLEGDTNSDGTHNITVDTQALLDEVNDVNGTSLTEGSVVSDVTFVLEAIDDLPYLQMEEGVHYTVISNIASNGIIFHINLTTLGEEYIQDNLDDGEIGAVDLSIDVVDSGGNQTSQAVSKTINGITDSVDAPPTITESFDNQVDEDDMNGSAPGFLRFHANDDNPLNQNDISFTISTGGP